MAHLSLAGVSADGSRLLLVDDRGTEHSLEISTGLKAALRGDATRLGQLEITMDSALRPRDIQSRIRSGESPESVAQAAGTTVERIMPFAVPVLAEREHVAGRAQGATVRRRAGETGGARTLGEAVAGHLRAVHVDPADVEWDAWRREDGRWSVLGVFGSPDRSGTAELVFDLRGNFVLLDNDDARWLVGEALDEVEDTTADEFSAARRRRAGLAGGELGDDAIDLVADPETGAAGGFEAPVEAFLDTDPVAAGATGRAEDDANRAAAADVAREPGDPVEAPATTGTQPESGSDTDAEPVAEAEPPARRTVSKKRGRASVPSWDEIMFGGNDT